MRNRELAGEILRMAKADQVARRAYVMQSVAQPLSEKLSRIDKANRLRLKQIVEEFGWPRISLVGKRASHMAWLLVQHADSNVEFQKQCLKLMEGAMRVGDIARSDLAYLTDRVLKNTGRPQVYGTQFYRDTRGRLVPWPIKDIGRLDELRRGAGLEPFEKYKGGINANG